jgi:hypothetical protein
MTPFVLVGAFLVLAASASGPTHAIDSRLLPATQTFQGLFAPVDVEPGVKPPLARAIKSLVFQTPGATSSHGPEVVCGTVVLRGDPGIDPGIVRRKPDTSTRFTMRRFLWPGCGQ